MKLPIVNKYYLINIFIYTIIVCAILGCLTHCLIIFERFGYLWLLFAGLFAITELSIPILIVASILEILFFKLKILRCRTLTINVSQKIQKIFYTFAIISFIYYLSYKIYFEPIMEKMLLND